MSDIDLLLLGPQLGTREGEEDDGHPMWTTMWRSRGVVVHDDTVTRYGDRLRYTYHEAIIEEIELGGCGYGNGVRMDGYRKAF
jgi:hypothetical protein